ncbi:hypothetical protein [Nonomuraea sp. SYSU D8015]|uniref:hypothetical protein n=1 Tax=Nonomuraea sp. SYSU D8015 TaxID=2593644 RepID=UPI001661502B|nr:hypothetical protein [Nonomuraea sp. SYSU D8015]
MKFEVYKEKFRVTEWRNDQVYSVESMGAGWFPEDEVKANVPSESGFLYTDKIHPEGKAAIRKIG